MISKAILKAPFSLLSPEGQASELAALSTGTLPLIHWQHMPVEGDDEQPEVATDPAHRLAIWRARFGDVSPKEVCESLLGAFAHMPGQSATLYLSDEGVYEGEPRPIMLVFRKGNLNAQFNLQVMEPLDQAKEAYFADAYVDAHSEKSEGRGTGMGGQITLQIVDTLKRFPNLEKLLVHAERTGSYAWAKMGFDVHDEAWRQNKQIIRQRLENVKGQLAGHPRVLELLNKALFQSPHVVHDTLSGLRKQTSFGEDPDHLGRPLDLGKYLFRNLSWEGSFDLKSEDAYRHLTRHVSGHVSGRG
jgi:hypothetical protein